MKKGVAGTRFVRHAPDGSGFVEICWDQVTDVFAGLASDWPLPPPPPPPPTMVETVNPPARRTPTQYLPQWLGDFIRAQWRALLAWPRLLVAMVPVSKPAATSITLVTPADVPTEQKVYFELAEFASGDALFAPGSTWLHEDYAGFVGGVVRRHGLRFAALFYDIIPLRRPEWCERGHTDRFRGWLHQILPHCDTILAISHHGAAELERYAQANDIELRRTVTAIPIGSGFAQSSRTIEPRIPARPPPDRDFILFVSTIEIRKNHQLLLRVWRCLLEEMPRGTVPLLVFAGQVGWMVSDLMAQLSNSDFLDGHVLVINDATDEELAELYRRCMFTVFPSLYEGWGLPVTESLAHGKPCLVSRSTSLPEAGQGFARYFDPEDIGAATNALRAAIEDRPALKDWEARIRRDYRPRSWNDTAQAVARSLRADISDSAEIITPEPALSIWCAN